MPLQLRRELTARTGTICGSKAVKGRELSSEFAEGRGEKMHAEEKGLHAGSGRSHSLFEAVTML